MGQAQSSQSDEDLSAEKYVAPRPPPQPHPEPEASAGGASSMESLIAEASAYGEDETESLEAKAHKALECPCVAELRSGPCGQSFTEAFLCFMKSTAEEKGSDCVNPFVALQECIKVHPDAFSKDVLGEGEEDQGAEAAADSEELKMRTPSWAREVKSKM